MIGTAHDVWMRMLEVQLRTDFIKDYVWTAFFGDDRKIQPTDLIVFEKYNPNIQRIHLLEENYGQSS